MRSKSEARREAILEAASQAFLDAGYELAVMSDIAARAGVSKATLYNYYPSKVTLFSAVVQRLSQREFGKLHLVLDPSRDIATVLNEYGCRYLEIVLSPYVRAFFRMVRNEAGRTDAGRIAFEQGYRVGWGTVAAYLALQMKANRLHQADPWTATMHLRSLYEAELAVYYDLSIVDLVEHEDRSQVVSRAVETFLAAYGEPSRTNG